MTQYKLTTCSICHSDTPILSRSCDICNRRVCNKCKTFLAYHPITNVYLNDHHFLMCAICYKIYQSKYQVPLEHIRIEYEDSLNKIKLKLLEDCLNHKTKK